VTYDPPFLTTAFRVRKSYESLPEKVSINRAIFP
jgi:hypothetical protein